MAHYEFSQIEPVVEYALVPTPPSGVHSWEAQVPIGDALYTFAYNWNASAKTSGLWSLGVYDDQDEAIIVGCRIVLGIPIGRTSTHDLFTSGRIVAVDMTGKHVEPGLYDLGQRVELRRYTIDQYLAANGFARTLVA